MFIADLAILIIWAQPQSQMPARTQAEHTHPAEDTDPIGLAMKRSKT